MSTIRRNEPCPCGSGKRFKHCHGKASESSPLLPREIVESVRFICFETHLEDFRLATNGGTAFVVRYKGKPFAVTCKHVLNGFQIDDLVITDARMGRRVAGIRGIYHPGNLRADAEGSDLNDVCVIAFHDGEDDFFKYAYDLDQMPPETSEPATRLVVTGFIKQKSFISPPNIFTGLCFLDFTDAGVAPFDRTLRRGLATYQKLGFDSISGISGAPVYNLANRALCGMVARGGLQSNGACTIYFFDIFDIMKFLDAITSGSQELIYLKDGSIL
jgi:hypothetical protein